MNVLIVYGSQFGTTEHLARAMGDALSPEHRVTVESDKGARLMLAGDTDLVFVGAPTQWGGHRILVRHFLTTLRDHGFDGVDAAAFDTRSPGEESKTGSAGRVIAEQLRDAGCRVVVPPESFIVTGYRGLAEGEEARARHWAVDVVRAVSVAVPVGT
jgi:flavodoxin